VTGKKAHNVIAMILMGLCLIGTWLVVGGVTSRQALGAADGTILAPYDDRYDLIAAKDKGKQIKYLTIRAKPEVDAALALMNQVDPVSGMSPNQMIDSKGGGLADILRAIVIHEASGVWKAKEAGNGGALCAFQIDPGTLPDVAKALGFKDTQSAGVALRNDLETCVLAGKWVLEQKLKGRSQDVALCMYNGQTTMLAANGNKCWASVEYRAIMEILGGKDLIYDVNNDKNSPHHGEITVMTSSGEVLATGLNCQDHTDYNLAKALADMADYYQIYTSEIRENTHVQVVQSMLSSGTRVPPSIGKLWCVDDLLMSMDYVAALKAGVSLLAGPILAAISGFLDSLCNYAISAIKAAADTIMNSICLPLPDLSYSMSLPSLKRKGCNGLSLARAMAVQGGMLSPADVNLGLADFIKGVAGINSLSTQTWSSPSLAAPLRSIFGSKCVGPGC